MQKWRLKMHEVIFEADTPAGKFFDGALLVAIVVSVAAVMLESVAAIGKPYARELLIIEWTFTILFTFEYFARIICIGRPLGYIFSFMGIIDLLAIIPTYLSLFVSGTQSLLVIRTIRLLRVFRVFKLGRYLIEGRELTRALAASGPKITVFLCGVIGLVIIMGTVMYLVEGAANGFTSIPRSIYWAIVTVTTVGYGDIAPQTVLGQFLASILMIAGYGIIAVPTGIVSAEMVKLDVSSSNITTVACPQCSQEGHEVDAVFCRYCSAILQEELADESEKEPEKEPEKELEKKTSKGQKKKQKRTKEKNKKKRKKK